MNTKFSERPRCLVLLLLFTGIVTILLEVSVKTLQFTVVSSVGGTSLTPSRLDKFTFLGQFSASPYVLAKRILVRSAYFDSRQRNGHRNAVVFFVEMERDLTPAELIGCRVGTSLSNITHFRYPKQYKWAITMKHVTKNIGMVDCYVHSVDIMDNDAAYLLVSMKDTNSTLEVKSQRNLIIPSSGNKLNLTEPTVVTCIAPVYVGKISPSKDGMLYHWLHYQKTIGVDHVHMIAEDTFLAAGYLDHPVIKTALKENYLSIDIWPVWFNNTEIFYRSQHLAYNDCLYRFQGVYDYIIFSDSDDFFVPVKENKSVKTYLKTWCSGKSASCIFNWLQFYPDNGWNIESAESDGNLTATLHCQKHTKRSEGKSAHQIRAVVDVEVHTAMELMPGYVKSLVPAKDAYFAHLRRGSKSPTGC